MRNKAEEIGETPNAQTSFSNKLRLNLFRFLLAHILFLPLFAAAFNAQDFPGEIRGYKVKKAKVNVKIKGEKIETKDKSDVLIKVGDPKMTGVSLTGVNFEFMAEIDALQQSGTVDFLTFKDFRVNGLSVDIEEYRNSFDFKKNEIIILPKPIKVFVNAGRGLLGAVSEIGNSKEEWTVTGRIFVFGKFKKFGMNFKRVVPVDVNIKIKNPIKNSNGVF